MLLREDDNLLRQTFFSILKHHNAPMAHKVDIVYALAQAWCYSESERDFEMLEQRIKDLQPHEMILVGFWWMLGGGMRATTGLGREATTCCPA